MTDALSDKVQDKVRAKADLLPGVGVAIGIGIEKRVKTTPMPTPTPTPSGMAAPIHAAFSIFHLPGKYPKERWGVVKHNEVCRI
ncbi:MAG: hypothetical protein WC340_01905 [Kiritimatiellia bacterium]